MNLIIKNTVAALVFLATTTIYCQSGHNTNSATCIYFKGTVTPDVPYCKPCKEAYDRKQKEEEAKRKATAKTKIQKTSSKQKDDDWWSGADKEPATTTISTTISNDDWWSGKDERKTVSTLSLDGGELVYGYFHSYFEDECTNKRIYVLTNIFKYSSLFTSQLKAVRKFRELLETKYGYNVSGCSGYLQYDRPINTFKNNHKLTHEALIQTRHNDLLERQEYVSNGTRYELIVINDFYPYGN